MSEDDVDGEWDCSTCEEKKLQAARNCRDEGDKNFIKIIYRREFHQCPLSSVDNEAVRIVNMVYLCEGGGLGGSRVSPDFFLYETAFYMNVRSIIFQEKRRIDNIKKEREQRKSRRGR